jgi:hypothetical protein
MTNEMETVGEGPKRDRWGRYLVVLEGGGKAAAMTRATTISSLLDSRHAIEKWQQRHVAVGLASRPDLLAQVQSTTIEDKQTLNSVCQKALDASGADAAASMGTALHRVVEKVNLDPEADVPEAFAERIAEYRRVMAAHGVTVCLNAVEQIHILAELGIAGMADAHVMVGGRRYIFDLKTGSSIDYGSGGYSVQLSIYAAAETLYDPHTETHRPMPEVDQERAIICHLPAKGGPATLKWLDITAGREALDHAVFAHRWRNRKDLLTPFDVPAATNEERPTAELIAEAFPGTTVDEAETADLLNRRRQRLLATLPFDVKDKWQAQLPGVRGPKAAEEWTPEQMDDIERVFELPFSDDPLPVDPPRAAQLVAPVVELRPRPALGGPVDAGALQMLRDRARRQSNGVKAWIKVWQAEAIEEGSADFKMGRGKHVTLWAFEVSRAAMYLARLAEKAETPEAGTEIVRRLVGKVVGDLAEQPGVTLGGLLGSLSLDEATELADLACDSDANGIDGEEVAS